MKRLLILCSIMLMTSVTMMAQRQHRKMDPDKFHQDMVSFVVKEAKLTQQEADAFVPVYKEMLDKQRNIFEKMRAIDKSNPQTDSECREKIKQHDKLDIELKKQQQSYHTRMMSIISPCKLLKVMQAEDDFHRRMLRKGRGGNEHGQKR